MSIVSVKYKRDGKSYYFDSDKFILNKEDFVLVDTEKGVQFGIVYDVFSDNSFSDGTDFKKVIKKADEEDYNIYLKNLKDSKIVLNDLRKKIIEDNIIMHVVDANYSFDRKHLIINFVADERIDFRDLVKYLAAKYKSHIELHQLGVRDKAKEIGGIGQCGKILCCKCFKSNMDGISINMAKNQNLSLSPNKINGCCGRLLCCLSYENSTYSELKDKLPKINDIINYDNKKYKVIRTDLLKSKVYIINDDGQEMEIDYGDK